MDNTSAVYRARPSILDPFPLSNRRFSVTGVRERFPGYKRFEIAATEAVSVQIGLGTTVQCVSGSIWLTQENDTRDYTVPAGTTFCADRVGRAVLTAFDGAAVAIVHYADAFDSGCVPGTVRVDSFERLTRAARKAQQTALANILKRFAAWFSSRLRKQNRARELPPSFDASARVKAIPPWRGACSTCGDIRS